jgi:hypothetical protein
MAPAAPGPDEQTAGALVHAGGLSSSSRNRASYMNRWRPRKVTRPFFMKPS